jgi:hypothetical protein
MRELQLIQNLEYTPLVLDCLEARHLGFIAGRVGLKNSQD